ALMASVSIVILSFSTYPILVNFFFQAEDGIRDKLVTGVQTCALPISFSPGRICVTRVAQLPREPRVFPQVPNGACRYVAKSHVWAMNSDATHTVSPSVAAAP